MLLQSRSIYFNSRSLLMLLMLFMMACKKEDYALPTAKDILQNDAIKRTLGPNIVGQQIEFAYAMAVTPAKGTKLQSAEVEASIAGGAGTFLQNNSFFTNGSGADVAVLVGSPSVTTGTKTTVTFTRDTVASTLRYYYVIPEEARGKTVSFTFTVKSSNGELASYQMGPYNIAKMDMIRNLTVSDGNVMYISIADMAVYNAAAAAANPSKIDLVYLYRNNVTTSAFNHSIVSPAADPQYLPAVALPAGVNKSTAMLKVFNLQDFNLAQLQFGIFIDDLDFEKIDLSTAPNFAINLVAQAGAWVETADKKYKAYVYVNTINNAGRSAVISIKRYSF
jgi:hypothetical protein